MAYSFLVFDFGVDEDAAQQARHRIDGLRQGFRLDKKLQLKFEREELEAKEVTAPKPSPKQVKGSSQKQASSGAKGKAAGEAAEESDSSPAAQPEIRLIVRLDFSDHEKLAQRHWIERISSEDIFKSAKSKVVRSGNPEFASIAERFDSLDHALRGERTGQKV
jgi:hypothetical protein